MLKRADWSALRKRKRGPCRVSFVFHFTNPSAHHRSAATMALEQNPTQNQGNSDLEFAWWCLRIKNDANNASDERLDAGIDTNEAFERAFAGVVLFGVLFEVIVPLV